MNDELLVKYLLGEADSGERDAVGQWIRASSENEKYFNHFQLIWETSKQLVIPSTINADDAWKRFQQRTEQVPGKRALITQLRFSRSWMRAASIAVLVTGIAVLSYLLSDRTSSVPVTVASATSPVTDTLPDGSYVTLNKNSSIRYPQRFRGNERKVELKGEAFFSVSPDKQKPFIINVNDVIVTVVGTSFNVKSFGGKTRVVVETGVVRVTKNNRSVELRANEELITNDADTILRKERVTDHLHQYYRSKEFVCDNTPLWKLVEVLNEAYNANIVIERNELRSLPLTTTFYNESLEKILSVIAETFDISVERRGDQVILK